MKNHLELQRKIIISNKTEIWAKETDQRVEQDGVRYSKEVVKEKMIPFHRDVLAVVCREDFHGGFGAQHSQ